MTYTAKIATSGPTNVSHTFSAPSDSLALAEARRVEADIQRRLGCRSAAVLDRLIRHDGTPASSVDLY